MSVPSSRDLLGPPVPHPVVRWYAARPAARALIRSRWRVTVRHPERVPATGGFILASNHVGLIDGPLLAIFGPRPVHALTKQEMFDSRAGGILRFAGQIRLDRSQADPAAVKACVRVIEDGGGVGIFPEGTRGDGELHAIRRGAAYLALVTGAPVVPVTMFGTREPGAGNHALPARGAHIEIVYGTPWRVGATAWPRTREQVGDASALLLGHLRSELDRARDLTGRALPGPLPAGESTDEPHGGAVDKGAS